MNLTVRLGAMIAGLTLLTQPLNAVPKPSTDPNVDPQVRAFLTEVNKDSSPFWRLPQTKPQEIFTALQNKTPVDKSGVTTVEKTKDQEMDECYAALKWVAAHAGGFGADGSRIAIAGNSVGGNMTAALTLMAKDRKGPKISYQVLFIPATDASVDTGSYREFATGFFLARAFMKYGWDLYAPDEKTRDLPYVSPLRASSEEFKGLPPALVIAAETDPLRDEGEAYAHKLMDTDVAVPAVRYDGMIHGFVALNALRNLPEPRDGDSAGNRTAFAAPRTCKRHPMTISRIGSNDQKQERCNAISECQK